MLQKLALPHGVDCTGEQVPNLVSMYPCARYRRIMSAGLDLRDQYVQAVQRLFVVEAILIVQHPHKLEGTHAGAFACDCVLPFGVRSHLRAGPTWT